MSVRNNNLIMRTISLIISMPFFLLFGATLFGQASSGSGGVPAQHPETYGTQMRFPMERDAAAGTHSEGILGQHFPNIHGNEAIHFDFVYTGGLFSNARGGYRTGNAYIGIFDLGITAGTENLGLWKNGTFYMRSFFSHGPNPSRFVGDYQGVGVFGYETPAQVSEYWYEHRFFEDFLTIKAGKQDAGVDFFYLESTADFINSSATCVPTTGIPTAPDNAWGMAAFFNVNDRVHIKAGFYDAQGNADKFWMSESGDIYSAYQIGYHYNICRHLPGVVYVGGWYDSSEFELWDGGHLRNGSYGFSAGLEQTIYSRRHCRNDDARGMKLFIQYSDTKEDRNELDKFFSVGLCWIGPFDRRSDDVFGLAFYKAKFSDGFRASEGVLHSSETTYEIFYKMCLSDGIAIQPVLQYVVNPGGQYKDSFVPGVVMQIVF